MKTQKPLKLVSVGRTHMQVTSANPETALCGCLSHLMSNDIRTVTCASCVETHDKPLFKYILECFIISNNDFDTAWGCCEYCGVAVDGEDAPELQASDHATDCIVQAADYLLSRLAQDA